MTRAFITAFLVSVYGAALALGFDEGDQKAKPSGEFRSPKSGEAVDTSFRVKGKTRDVPEGFVVVLFRTLDKGDFLFPCTEPFRGNRTFSEEIQHEPNDRGSYTLQIRTVQKDVAKEIEAWRKKTIRWYEGGRKGDAPAFTPSWMEATKGIGSMRYVIE